MAGPEILTKDDVPLEELGDFALTQMDVFNSEASRGFIDLVSTEVSSRTFMARTGDMTWDEVAELEHARTASLDDYQMAFNVDTYAKDLGFTREYIEDSPSELVREHISEVVAGGEDKMFDVVFDVMKNGIADGSQLWYSPEDHGAHSFTDTHNHTYTGLNNNSTDTSKVLFGDTSTHSPSEIVAELNRELRHHGYDPDVALMPDQLAREFVEELTDGYGSQFSAGQAENLRETALPEQNIRVDGVNIMQTQWLTEDANGEWPIYVFDTSSNPVKTNTVRPMEMTDNTGAPVGGAGGFRGDPGAMLGAYGSMRFGAKFADPLAGVTANITPSELTTE